MSLEDQIKQAEKENGQSKFYKLEDGLNQLRILVAPASISKCFVKSANKTFVCYGKDKGCKYPDDANKASIRWMTWVVNTGVPAAEQSIQLAELPHTIVKELLSISKTPDYHFDAYPVPYDIYVTKTKEGDKTSYKVTAARNNTPVDGTIMEVLKDKDLPEAIVNSMKYKAMEADGLTIEYTGSSNPADIPF